MQIVANEPQKLGPVRLGLPDARLVVRSNRPAPTSASAAPIAAGHRSRSTRAARDRARIIAKDGYESAVPSATLGPGETRARIEPCTDLRTRCRRRRRTPKSCPTGTRRARLGRRVPPDRGHAPDRGPRAGFRLSRRADAATRPATGDQRATRRSSRRWRRSPALRPQPRLRPPAAGTHPRRRPAPSGPIPATIRTKSGQELKLVPAGAYTMGSAARVGRPARNGSQRRWNCAPLLSRDAR